MRREHNMTRKLSDSHYAVHNQERTRTLLVALSLACLEIRFVVEGAGAVMLRFCLEYKRVLYVIM